MRQLAAQAGAVDYWRREPSVSSGEQYRQNVGVTLNVQETRINELLEEVRSLRLVAQPASAARAWEQEAATRQGRRSREQESAEEVQRLAEENARLAEQLRRLRELFTWYPEVFPHF